MLQDQYIYGRATKGELNPRFLRLRFLVLVATATVLSQKVFLEMVVMKEIHPTSEHMRLRTSSYSILGIQVQIRKFDYFIFIICVMLPGLEGNSSFVRTNGELNFTWLSVTQLLYSSLKFEPHLVQWIGGSS